jgi:hypothetical protein
MPSPSRPTTSRGLIHASIALAVLLIAAALGPGTAPEPARISLSEVTRPPPALGRFASLAQQRGISLADAISVFPGGVVHSRADGGGGLSVTDVFATGVADVR